MDLELVNQKWCDYHRQYEDLKEPLTICGGCGHIFDTELELISAHRDALRKAGVPVEEHSEAASIYTCPYCLHDW